MIGFTGDKKVRSSMSPSRKRGALTEMESPTVKGLENCNDTPLSMFPKISLVAKAVATPIFSTKNENKIPQDSANQVACKCK
jgi:hypothetical protein